MDYCEGWNRAYCIQVGLLTGDAESDHEGQAVAADTPPGPSFPTGIEIMFNAL